MTTSRNLGQAMRWLSKDWEEGKSMKVSEIFARLEKSGIDNWEEVDATEDFQMLRLTPETAKPTFEYFMTISFEGDTVTDLTIEKNEIHYDRKIKLSPVSVSDLDEKDLEYIEWLNGYIEENGLKTVTQATERRVNQIIDEGGAYSGLVKDLWDLVRESNSVYLDHLSFRGYRDSIRRLKELGTQVQASYLQYNIDRYTRAARALECNTDGEVFKYVGTLDLSYVNITDFNEFIKQVVDLRASMSEYDLFRKESMI